MNSSPEAPVLDQQPVVAIDRGPEAPIDVSAIAIDQNISSVYQTPDAPVEQAIGAQEPISQSDARLGSIIKDSAGTGFDYEQYAKDEVEISPRRLALGLALGAVVLGPVVPTPVGSVVDRADAKYHFVNEGLSQTQNIAEYPTWDALNAPGEGLIVSNTRPPQTPNEQWAQRFSFEWKDEGTGQLRSGEVFADQVHQILSGPNPPAKIIFDEVRVNSIDRAAAFARTMLTKYPEHNGKWGAALVDGPSVNYEKLKGFLTPALKADADILVEFYPNANDYFKQRPLYEQQRVPGTNRTKTVKIPFSKLNPQQVQEARNRWMGDYISGRGGYGYNNIPKLNMLMELRQDLGSHSTVIPLIAVTDKFTGGAVSQSDYMATEVHVLKNYTRWGKYLINQNPVGSWKNSRDKLSGTTRDSALVRINQHYHAKGSSAKLRPFPKQFKLTPKTKGEYQERFAAGYRLPDKNHK